MFPELEAVQGILKILPADARTSVLATINAEKNVAFPIHAIVLGSQAETAPVLILCGGVHGLERIGTQVVISYLTTLCELAAWDQFTQQLLRRIRIVAIPLINPVGMYHQRRGNRHHVDLMRNAPTRPEGKGAWLLGGQRLSSLLPWYMGKKDRMEVEAQVTVDFLWNQSRSAETVISLDLHSGYGQSDRILFPYGYTRRPFFHLPQMFALKKMLDRALPHHVYLIEPQCQIYRVRGDLWDYFYDRTREHLPHRTYLPLTLEMGSWLWIRKNPRQLANFIGAFNPTMPHREKRILRRHLLLLDFLARAVASSTSWSQLTVEEQILFFQEANELWYGHS